MDEQNPSGMMPDHFDRLLAALDGLPDVARTKQAIIRVMPPLGVGGSETFIVQPVRQRGTGEKDRSRDTIFLEHVTAGRAIRIVMPTEVADAIARQRDQLTAINRRKGARAAVETRKERGIVPAFLKHRRGVRRHR